MKKINNFFVLLIVGFGFLCQPLQISGEMSDFRPDETLMIGTAFALTVVCPELIVLWGAGVVAVSINGVYSALDEAYQQNQRDIKDKKLSQEALNKQYEEAYLEHKAMFETKSDFLKTDFSGKIKDRINALINQEYTNQKTNESFKIFSTPRSKIFVLQNIEDFFDFEQDNKFKAFNSIVYDVCMKKINKLQLIVDRMDKKTPAYGLMVTADNLRHEKMKKFKILVSTLKDMSSEDLNKTIDMIKKAIVQSIIDLTKKIKEIDAKKPSALEMSWFFSAKDSLDASKKEKKTVVSEQADLEFRALWSIFVHLSYKQQSKKQPMFAGEGLQEAQGRVELEQEAKKIVPQRLTDEKLAQKREDLKELLAKKYAMGTKSLEPIAQWQQEVERKKQEEIKAESLRLEDQEKRRLHQKSWWGNVRSSIGSWFGRQ